MEKTFLIIQLIFFAVICVLVNAYFVGSLIQEGRFESYHIVFGLLSICSVVLVKLGINELKSL